MGRHVFTSICRFACSMQENDFEAFIMYRFEMKEIYDEENSFENNTIFY